MAGLEEIDKAHGRLGWPEVVQRLAVGKLEAALLALVLVVLAVDVADAQLQLEVPVLAEDEVVTIGNAAAGEPALIAVTGQRAEVPAEELAAFGRKARDVIDATKRVNAQEMARETVAEPVADLRLGRSHGW